MSRNDVDRLINTYLSAIMSRDKNHTDALAEKLYDTFLKPVIPFVYGDRVGFVPHRTLYNLPFAAMRYMQSYLVDGFTIFHLSHSGLLKQLLPKKSMPGVAKVIILADSPCVEKQQLVAYAGEEMSVITQLWDVEDKPKAALMEMIYKNLEKSSSTADALRAAQNGMIQMGYGPSDWAAFIMTGQY